MVAILGQDCSLVFALFSISHPFSIYPSLCGTFRHLTVLLLSSSCFRKMTDVLQMERTKRVFLWIGVWLWSGVWLPHVLTQGKYIPEPVWCHEEFWQLMLVDALPSSVAHWVFCADAMNNFGSWCCWCWLMLFHHLLPTGSSAPTRLFH